MNTSQGGRPSTDRRPAEGGLGARRNNSQQALDATGQYAHGAANGYEGMDAPRPRFTGPAAGDGSSTNGSSSPADGRSGRTTGNAQNLPYRERSQSRDNGGAGAKTGNGNKRACKKCGEALTGQFVRALGGTFHLDCFRCRVSSDSIFSFIHR